jgi:hypothetical protein
MVRKAEPHDAEAVLALERAEAHQLYEGLGFSNEGRFYHFAL